VTKVSPEAMAILTRHTWPGNVRELENVVYRSAVIAQGDAILVKDLPAELGGLAAMGGSAAATATASVTAAATGTSAPAPSATHGSAQPLSSSAPSEPVARVNDVEAPPPLTLERAFDFIFAELKDQKTSMLEQAQRELARRTLTAHEGNETTAAKKLGLTKTALKRLLE
jgi:two-component system nitrogen regulation response regulator GlnG